MSEVDTLRKENLVLLRMTELMAQQIDEAKWPAVQNAFRAAALALLGMAPETSREIQIGAETSPVERQPEAQNLVLLELRKLRREVFQMATTVVTRDQFDAALQTLLAAEAARDAAVTKALSDLIAKVNSGTVTTPEDFTAELASITQLQANAAALTQTATADDPGSTNVTAPPTTTSN